MDPQDRLFGEIAVRLQLLTREQVGACIDAQRTVDASKRIGEVALGLGLISRDDATFIASVDPRKNFFRSIVSGSRRSMDGRQAPGDSLMRATLLVSRFPSWPRRKMERPLSPR